MARVTKPEPSLDAIFFSTPEQRVARALLAEPTTSFSLRVLSSKLKGVRGLGGAEGLMKILEDLEKLGLVAFLDHRRSVRLRDDSTTAQMLKRLGAICDLESLCRQLEPVSDKGILFGSRASGRARSDSDYDLFVVTNAPEQVHQIAGSHPLGKALEIVAWTSDNYGKINNQDPRLARKLEQGVVLWGPVW